MGYRKKTDYTQKTFQINVESKQRICIFLIKNIHLFTSCEERTCYPTGGSFELKKKTEIQVTMNISMFKRK